MKLKVSERIVLKKWNGPIVMHIYDKQCEIMQNKKIISPKFQMGRQDLFAKNIEN